MAKTVFENRTNFTKSLLLEAYRPAWRKKMRKRQWGCLPFALLATLSLLAVLILPSLLSRRMFDGMQIPVGLLILIIFVCLLLDGFAIYTMFGYRLIVSRQIKNDKQSRLLGVRQAQFSSMDFFIRAPQYQMTYRYKDIVSFSETQNLFILMYGAEMLIFDKQGFTKGTPDAFRDFLHKNLLA